jgi:GTPase SAR1 family protein
MSEELPRDRAPDALPGSELPKYNPVPEADEYDEAADRYGRYSQYEAADDDDYLDPAHGEADDDDPSVDPLSVPRDTPDSRLNFDWNGQGSYRSRADSAREQAPDYEQQPRARTSGYAQGQAAAGNVDPGAMKISLWGSPACGKTTFLAVLRHAAEGKNEGKVKGRGKEKDSDIGHWSIYPMSSLSTRFMADFTHELSRGYFPSPTLPGEEIKLQWLFDGDITNSKFVRRRDRVRHRGKVESKFVLDLVDASGHVFAHDPTREKVPQSVADEALQRLIEANGIVYLFDPIGERENRNSFDYVNRAITELMYRAAAGGNRSPQFKQQIAVCVTKFDDPAVFQEARRNGFVTYDEHGIPRVPDENAEQFFDLLCSDDFWRKRYEESARSANFIRSGLKQVFSSANIQYYVTSSIGFYQPPGLRARGARFDPDDFTNVVKGADKRPRIRGAVNPINVLEPLVSVHQRFFGQAQPR